jgi:hypothetical protein
MTGQLQIIFAGVGSMVGAVLLLGLRQFFNQIARSASATEETARLLRERPSV